MQVKEVISAYQARIGRRGGLKSSPAKRVAARAAACKRWGREAILPVTTLTDGHWYSGKGRNAKIGLWDERAHCFWVVLVIDAVDPLHFPEPGLRSVRLKRERHSAEGGTFHPSREVG